MKKITLLAFCAFWFPIQAQNNCATALTATVGVNETGTISGTQLPNPDCSNNDPFFMAANWYKFTASQSGFITISSVLPENNGTDTRLHVFSGACGALVCLGFNDDFTLMEPGSKVTFPAIAGQTYYFAWDDYWTDESFFFTLTESTVNCPDTLPYVEDFSDGVVFEACYAPVDGDGSGLSFVLATGPDFTGDGIEDNFVVNILNPSGAKDDWLFSPEFTFEAGSTYEIIPYFNVLNSTGEDISFVVADEASGSSSFLEVLGSFAQAQPVGETNQELYDNAYAPVYAFTPPQTGTYRFGMHVHTPMGNGFTVLFGYSITQIMNTGSWESSVVRLYPNPTSGQITITSQHTIDEVEVFNLLGQKVLLKSLSAQSSMLDVSALSSGTYILRARSGQGWSQSKFIKQ